MASFQDNLSQLEPECPTILDFAAAKDNEVGGYNQNSTHMM